MKITCDFRMKYSKTNITENHLSLLTDELRTLENLDNSAVSRHT